MSAVLTNVGSFSAFAQKQQLVWVRAWEREWAQGGWEGSFDGAFTHSQGRVLQKHWKGWAGSPKIHRIPGVLIKLV